MHGERAAARLEPAELPASLLALVSEAPRALTVAAELGDLGQLAKSNGEPPLVPSLPERPGGFLDELAGILELA